MDEKILAVYCLSADVLNAIGHAEDPQQQMSDAEVITTGLSDVRMLKTFQFDVPEWSHVYADKAYNDYVMEDVLLEASHIQLYPIRKKNSKRTLPPYIAYVQHDYRKRIETVGSLIERMLPKTIHAVTTEGFELKVFLFVLAYSLNCL